MRDELLQADHPGARPCPRAPDDGARERAARRAGPHADRLAAGAATGRRPGPLARAPEGANVGLPPATAGMTDVRSPRTSRGVRTTSSPAGSCITRGAQRARASSAACGACERSDDGVYLTGLAPPTQRQRWWTAVLSAPGTVLSQRERRGVLRHAGRSIGPIVTVARVGTRGREHSRGLLVSYSLTLRGQVTERDGLPITTVERTIIDLWPHLSPRARVRMLREALRLRRPRRHACWRRSAPIAGAAGSRRCASRCEKLGGLRLERCQSDAEAFAVAVLPTPGARCADVNGRSRRDGGRPQLAGAPAHHRARRPVVPRASRRGHAQDARSGRPRASPSAGSSPTRLYARARRASSRSSRGRTSGPPAPRWEDRRSAPPRPTRSPGPRRRRRRPARRPCPCSPT